MVTEAVENKYVQVQIAELARMNGLSPKDVDLQKVETLYGYFELPKLIPELGELENKYIAPIGQPGGTLPLDQRAIEEREHRFCLLAEAILDKEPAYYSYGLFIPSYLKMLQSYKQAASPFTPERSLLVGALSINGIREYASAVKRVFPQTETYVADIAGSEITKEPGFIFADALRLPFASGSFSLINTNILLGWLKDDKSEDRKNSRINFSKEAHRVLRPLGQLMMVEGLLRTMYKTEDRQEAMDRMREELKLGGFRDIKIDFAEEFKRWSLMYEFLGSRTQFIDSSNINTSTNELAISASK